MALFRRKRGEDPADEDRDASTPAPQGVGPGDESDAPHRDDLLDCGALRIPVLDAATLQFTVDRTRDLVLGAVYILGDSALQLQVFAAPKSRGIWADVRADMISSIASQGGSSREGHGDYGTEIRAQMPIEGHRSINPVRYVGSRWLLRATLTGKAAVDDDASRALLHLVLDDTVVVRGNAAFPPRDILPLSIPKAGPVKEERPALELPKRGPEISEVR